MIARIVVVVLAWVWMIAPARADDAQAAGIRSDLARGYDANVLATCARLNPPTDALLESCTIAACRTLQPDVAIAYASGIVDPERIVFVASGCELAGVALPSSIVDRAHRTLRARQARSERRAWVVPSVLFVLLVIAVAWSRQRGRRGPLVAVAVVALAHAASTLASSEVQSLWLPLASGFVGIVAFALARQLRASGVRVDAAPARASDEDEARLDLELARMDGHGELPAARARTRKR